jgi:hypothetical protein
MKTLLALLVFAFFSSLQAKEPITFATLKSRIEDIPQVAWTNTHHLIKSNRASSSPLLDLEILVGPNTKLYFEECLFFHPCFRLRLPSDVAEELGQRNDETSPASPMDLPPFRLGSFENSYFP